MITAGIHYPTADLSPNPGFLSEWLGIAGRVRPYTSTLHTSSKAFLNIQDLAIEVERLAELPPETVLDVPWTTFAGHGALLLLKSAPVEHVFTGDANC